MAFGRGKSNHTLARCAFFYHHCFTKIIETECCDESPDNNTIGKKIHTLVKENTPCCHKIRQECGFTQKTSSSFVLCIIVFSSPWSCKQIVAGRLDSYLLTHTKKYMTHIHALIFEKHVKLCVYARHVKKPV